MVAGRLCLLLLIVGCVVPAPLTEKRPPEFSRGEEAYLRGDTSTALAEFERFRRIHPQSPYIAWAHYYEGLCLLVEGKPYLARERLESARKGFLDPADRAQALMGIGDAYFLQDLYEEAEGAYLSARGLGGVPTDEVLYKAALAARRLGEWDVAETRFKQIVHQFPDGRRVEDARRQLDQPEDFFSIAAGTFQVRENANRRADAIRSAGLETRLQEVPAGSGTLYRVCVGRYTDYYLAQQEMAALRQKGVISEGRIVP